MSASQENDQDIEEAKRIMERLVKMPHKPHVEPKQPRGKSATAKKNPPKKNKKGTG